MAIALANFAASPDLHAQTLIQPGSTGGKHAFSLVPVDDWTDAFPGWELIEVVDINRNLDLLCLMQDAAGNQSAFVRKVNSDAIAIQNATWYQVTGDGQTSLIPLDFNDDGDVVGYYWDSQQTYKYGFKAEFQSGVWNVTSYFLPPLLGGAVTGINTPGDLCGYEDGAPDDPLALQSGSEGWTALVDPPGVWASGALALSERFGSPPRSLVAGQGLQGLSVVGIVWNGPSSATVFDSTDAPRPIDVSAPGVICGFRTDAATGADTAMVWLPVTPFVPIGGYNAFPFTAPAGYDPSYAADCQALDMNHEHDQSGAGWGVIALSNGGVLVWNGQYSLQLAEFAFVPVHRHVNYPLRAVDGSFIASCVEPHSVVMTPDPLVEKNFEVFAGAVEPIDSDASLIPVIVFPHDADNNAVCDYREIALGSAADTDGDWVLDWAQDFRSGIYSVDNAIDSTRNRTEYIESSQIVRMHYDVNEIRDNVVGGTGNLRFEENIAEFGINKLGRAPMTEREIIIMARTPNPADAQQDYVPLPTDQALIFEALACFAHQTARSIDYFQVGNESYTAGPGAIYFSSTQLPSLANGGTFKTIQDEIWEVNMTAGAEAVDDATDVYFEYLEAMSDVVRGASGMRGRPIRILSPSGVMGAAALSRMKTSRGTPPDGWDLEYACWILYYTLQKSNIWADMHDIHLHWDNTDDGQKPDAVAGVCEWMLGAPGPSGGNWLVEEDVVPEQLGTTEWGAKANDAFWDSPLGSTNFIKYFRDDMGPPYGNLPFDTYVDSMWLQSTETTHRPADVGYSDQSGIDRILPDIRNAGFAFGCYGEALMGGQPGGDGIDIFSIASLCAPSIRSPYGNTERSNYWLLKHFQDASQHEMIGLFDLNHAANELSAGEISQNCTGAGP